MSKLNFQKNRRVNPLLRPPSQFGDKTLGITVKHKFMYSALLVEGVDNNNPHTTTALMAVGGRRTRQKKGSPQRERQQGSI